MASTLSVCLIVKDEASILGPCLDSVKGLAQQVVVCDTGSTDNTVKIAEKSGATVCHFEWTNDFAAARNAALAHATGDYILLIDADERLSRASKKSIKQALKKPDWDVGLLELFNASRLDATESQVLSGAASLGEGVLLPRVFRRTPDFRWEGVVHESPKTWLQSTPREAQVLKGAIIHLGCVPELRTSLKKSERNLSLLEKRAQHEPENSVVWGYLAREYLQAERRLEATVAIDTGYRALQAQKARGERPSIVTVVTLKLQALLEQGDFEAMIQVADEANGWGDPHPNIPILKGLAAATLAQTKPDQRKALLDEADRCFTRCLNWTHTLTRETVPGALSWAAAERLANVRLAQGRFDEAVPLFRRALKKAPSTLGCELGLVEALWRQKELGPALKKLEPLLTDVGPDAWVLAAHLVSELSGPNDMVAMVQRAMGLVAKNFKSPHRFGLLEEALLEARLYTGQAQAGPGLAGALGAVIGGEPLGRKHIDFVGIDRILKNLIQAGRANDLKALLSPQAQQALPGVGQAVSAFIASRRSG